MGIVNTALSAICEVYTALVFQLRISGRFQMCQRGNGKST